MAKRRAAIKGSKSRRGIQRDDPRGRLLFSRNNILFLWLGLLALLVGYVALEQGSITLAPLLLIAGYCLVIPLALLPWKIRSKNTNHK